MGSGGNHKYLNTLGFRQFPLGGVQVCGEDGGSDFPASYFSKDVRPCSGAIYVAIVSSYRYFNDHVPIMVGGYYQIGFIKVDDPFWSSNPASHCSFYGLS